MDEIPVWLNNEFLEKALNSQNESNLKVLSSEITKATAPGDNYGSHIYRATALISTNGYEEKKSFIIKAELTNPELRKLVSEMNGFQREINAFTFAIPQLQNLVEENAPGIYRPYGAKCYYTCKDSQVSVLVFEDLKQAGFRLANPAEVLDNDHCFLVVNTLATYHAASVVLNNKTSKTLENVFKESVYSESSRNCMDKLFMPMFRKLVDEAENWPECKGEIMSKLRLLEANALEYLMECVKINETDFAVLAHEDVWVNNLMFRYSEDDKEVVDVRFMDFQITNWTSPVIDLLYFINASATIGAIKNPQIIINAYYKSLKESFTAFGQPNLCPSKEYIHEEFEKRCKFGVIVGLVARSGVLMDRSDIPDHAKSLNNESFINFSESYRKDAKQMLSIFHERGWL